MRARACVGVSQATCDHLVETLALPSGQVLCVPNGVPTPEGNRLLSRTSLQLEEHDRLLLAVGNLYAVKGHRTLVEAADLLARRNDLPPWRIAIAGRGDEEHALRQQISELRLESRVQLLGLRSDIGDLLAAADLWVMPSLSEGLPMALLEAMFVGLPIVATNVGGIPNVIRDSSNGLLVPPENPESLARALSMLLREPAVARQFGERARMTARDEYSVEQMASRYVSLYSSALNRRVRRP